MNRRKKKNILKAYVPSESEIAVACKLIQATWSAKERARRRVVKETEHHWEAPQISTRELRYR